MKKFIAILLAGIMIDVVSLPVYAHNTGTNFEREGIVASQRLIDAFEDIDTAITDATDTLIGKATADILTNKTLDVDGSGNVITNVNGTELDSIALGSTAVFGIPFDIVSTISNLDADGASLIQDSAFKYIVVGAELTNTSAPDAAATWQVCQGTASSIGTAITEAVAADDADKIKTSALSFDDAASTIASGAGGDLCVKGDASGTLDGILIVHCIRID